MSTATLLVPVASLDGEQPELRTGRAPDGRPLLWAFTDAEALRAWDREPARYALEIDAQALLSASERSGAVIAVNAAGPGACVIDPLARDAPAPGGDPGPGATPVAPARRQTLRHTAHAAHERARDAIAAGDSERARAELKRSIAACGELGDRLHGAAAAIELARCLEQAGSTEAALVASERAAEILGEFGEEQLAARALEGLEAR